MTSLTTPNNEGIAYNPADVETIMRGFDAGLFVRDISHDHESGWAVRAFPYLAALGRLAKQRDSSPCHRRRKMSTNGCRDPYAWIWNEYARDLSADVKLLGDMCADFCDAKRKSTPIPFPTAMRSLDLLRRELHETRDRVAKECAPWFDGSAFHG